MNIIFPNERNPHFATNLKLGSGQLLLPWFEFNEIHPLKQKSINDQDIYVVKLNKEKESCGYGLISNLYWKQSYKSNII